MEHQHRSFNLIQSVMFIIIGVVVMLGIGYLSFNFIFTNPPATNDAEINTTNDLDYAIVDTGQSFCSDNSQLIECPELTTSAHYGQDAQFGNSQPNYIDNEDGTITDRVTGLMWQADPGPKQTYSQAVAAVEEFELAGYTDWRVPTIKELYSLIDFSGTDPANPQQDSTSNLTPFIDTDYFNFAYGDPNNERVIDSQWVTNTTYKSTVMDDQECFFGVNFADGRIKCYPTSNNKGYYAIYVRGNSAYGQNELALNEDETIVTDAATGLEWMRADSSESMGWEQALAFCETNGTSGFSDWRLPNAKELHSIVDYSRSPETAISATADPLFEFTAITNEADQTDYGFYWTSTTHLRSDGNTSNAVYVSFGRAMGYMEEFGGWVDVHGAGAQRSDPKSGDPSAFPRGMGPQGDARRISNYVRCVRSGDVTRNIVTSKPDIVQIVQSTSQQEAPANETSAQAAGQLPPREAIAACENSEEGSGCQFTMPDGEVVGNCREVAEVLACVPAPN